MKLELRYARSFIDDLKKLDLVAKKRVLNFVFVEFAFSENLHSLPQLRQIDAEGIFHRFTLDNYLVGIEVTGKIVKFLRVIPMPDV
ncbi:MAG: cytotoxic translational repressor of toxin-antitoxin stability system [Rivularia sp. ALOHA_DT_140]|nr:cytotoxic translational repressor of toxin-antitoxin stability system [Rivularia sp. ALOHA_DT_140]